VTISGRQTRCGVEQYAGALHRVGIQQTVVPGYCVTMRSAGCRPTGLRDVAAVCVIVGGMLVGGLGIGLASAHPASGRHHSGERHSDAGGTGHTGVLRRPMSMIGAGPSTGFGVSLPSVGAPIEAERPRGAAERHRRGTPIGRNVELGGGAQLRSGVELDNGVRIGGGVRIGRDIAMLQSATTNTAGQRGNGPTPVGGPQSAPGNLSTPNLPTTVQPGPNRLGAAAVPGWAPIARPGGHTPHSGDAPRADACDAPCTRDARTRNASAAGDATAAGDFDGARHAAPGARPGLRPAARLISRSAPTLGNAKRAQPLTGARCANTLTAAQRAVEVDCSGEPRRTPAVSDRLHRPTCKGRVLRKSRWWPCRVPPAYF
jgi:hypothetical protein